MLSAFAFVFPTFAQQSATDKVKEIQRGDDYLFATGISQVNDAEAVKNATDQVESVIKEWLNLNSGKADNSSYLENAMKNLQIVDISLGRIYRKFAYIKKADVLLSYSDGDELLNVEEPKLVAEEPIAESPKIEEPVVESPKVEEPVAVEPLEDKTERISEEVAEPVVEPVAEPVVEPVVEPVSEVVPEQPREIEPEPMAEKQAEETAAAEQTEGGAAAVDVEQQICKLYSRSAIEKYFKTLGGQGRIKAGGTLKSASQLPTTGVAYVMICDFNKIARRHIRVSDGTAINILSSEIVDISELLEQYKTGTAVWFSLK